MTLAKPWKYFSYSPLEICTSNSVPQVKGLSFFNPQLLKRTLAFCLSLLVRHQISHIQYIIFFCLKIMIKICISSQCSDFSSVKMKYSLHRSIFYLASKVHKDRKDCIIRHREESALYILYSLWFFKKKSYQLLKSPNFMERIIFLALFLSFLFPDLFYLFL